MYKVCDKIIIKGNREDTASKCEIRDIFPQGRCLLVHDESGLTLISYDDIVKKNKEVLTATATSISKTK